MVNEMKTIKFDKYQNLSCSKLGKIDSLDSLINVLPVLVLTTYMVFENFKSISNRYVVLFSFGQYLTKLNKILSVILS